jgi:hypothetical protein
MGDLHRIAPRFRNTIHKKLRIAELGLAEMIATLDPPRSPQSYPHTTIDLGSIAGLLEHEHKLAANCPKCCRWSVLPLAEMVSQGKGSLPPSKKVR